MMKRAPYQAEDIARQYDPQLAYLYYREGEGWKLQNKRGTYSSSV
jgi:hypothetical protein